MKTFHLAHLAISNRSWNRDVILKGDSIPSIWSLDSIGNEKLRQKLSNPILGLLFLLFDKIPKKPKKPCGKLCMEFPPTSLFSNRCSSSFKQRHDGSARLTGERTFKGRHLQWWSQIHCPLSIGKGTNPKPEANSNMTCLWEGFCLKSLSHMFFPWKSKEICYLSIFSASGKMNLYKLVFTQAIPWKHVRSVIADMKSLFLCYFKDCDSNGLRKPRNFIQETPRTWDRDLSLGDWTTNPWKNQHFFLNLGIIWCKGI